MWLPRDICARIVYTHQEAAGPRAPQPPGTGCSRARPPPAGPPQVSGARRVRLGITLPQFRHEPEPALEVARAAEAAGIDGVFVFDHMWPLGRPDRPALHGPTLLGALAAETERAALGTLVARVGMVPDAALVDTLATAGAMLGQRLIAGLGTGDAANRDENRAYGAPFPPAAQRIARLRWCCRQLRERGVRTWIGGRSPDIRRVAAEEADAWNGWVADTARFAAEAATVREAAGRPVEITWAGQVLIGRDEDDLAAKQERHGARPDVFTGTVDDLRRHLRALELASTSWAVCAPIDVGGDRSVVETLAMAASDRR